MVNYVTPIGSYQNSSSKNQHFRVTSLINRQDAYPWIKDEESKHRNDELVDSTEMIDKTGKKLNVSQLSEDLDEITTSVSLMSK